VLKIDGQQGEGGGQVLRSSLAFSAFTGRSFRIFNIRGRRSRPGLRPQHLAAVTLAATLCNAQVQGAELNSGDLQFVPGRISSGFYRVDVGTAGSVTLLTQAVLIPALMCGELVEFELIGGTDVPKAPPVDYLSEVVLPYFHHLGEVNLEVERRGFHPKGQGCVRLRVQGHSAPSRKIEAVHPPAWDRSQARIVVSNGLSKARVAERIRDGLAQEIDQIQCDYVEAASAGVAVTLWATDESGHRIGVSHLGRPRLSSERLAQQCVEAFRNRLSSESLIEEHLADQLIPILALTGGTLQCQNISDHCRTNIEICSLFTQRVFELGENHVVSA
jgi:RNA 3'-phosphate cyclase